MPLRRRHFRRLRPSQRSPSPPFWTASIAARPRPPAARPRPRGRSWREAEVGSCGGKGRVEEVRSHGRDFRMDSTPDILQRYEEMFIHRFTSDDAEYQEYVNSPAAPPPVVEDWLNRERRVPSTLEILQNFEKMFVHRFSAEDEEYQKYVQRPEGQPPLLGDWRSRSGGRDRFRDNRQFRGRGDRYDQQGGYRSSQWQERGWGNSYQQQRQSSYSQHGRAPRYGYSSYSPGPQYGHY